MVRMLTWPLRFALNVTLDVLFGKKEEFDYPHPTTPRNAATLEG